MKPMTVAERYNISAYLKYVLSLSVYEKKIDVIWFMYYLIYVLFDFISLFRNYLKKERYL